MPDQFTCRQCGCTFSVPPDWTKRGAGGRYCGLPCYHASRVRPPDGPWACTRCGETKTSSDFYRSRGSSDGFSRACKACMYAKKRAAEQTHYLRNKEEYLARKAQWRRANIDKVRAYSRANREKISEQTARWAAARKAQALTTYGGDPPSCACCSESLPGLLTIDHIDGSGAEHRRTEGQAARQIYRWLYKNDYPSGFRVLCFSCNSAMGLYGRCPHTDPTAGNPFRE